MILGIRFNCEAHEVVVDSLSKLSI